MAVTKTDSVIGSEGVMVCQCPTGYRGAPCTRGWDTNVERGTVGVKVRVGGTEVEIPSEAIGG